MSSQIYCLKELPCEIFESVFLSVDTSVDVTPLFLSTCRGFHCSYMCLPGGEKAFKIMLFGNMLSDDDVCSIQLLLLY